jgi:hypothetical protein
MAPNRIGRGIHKKRAATLETPESASTTTMRRTSKLPRTRSGFRAKHSDLPPIPPMTANQKINAVFWISLAVLGVAGFIRWNVFAPQHQTTVPDAAEEWSKDSPPECNKIVREQDERFKREGSSDDAVENRFFIESEAIDNSSLPEPEKEIRIRRLIEKYNISKESREANSDVAFEIDWQELEKAGCFKK